MLLLIVPEDPSKSRLLNAAERKLALARIDADQVVKTQGRKEKTTLKLVLRAFNFIVSPSPSLIVEIVGNLAEGWVFLLAL